MGIFEIFLSMGNAGFISSTVSPCLKHGGALNPGLALLEV